MDENKIELTVKVNSETGQLDVLSNKLGSVASGMGSLFSALGLIASGGAVIKFFKDSIDAAEQEALAMRRLRAVYGESAMAIKQWSEGLQKATSFSNDQAITTFERLAKATRNTAEAQSAAKLAMDISVATGTNLAHVTEILFNLINGQSRAVKSAHDEFGNLIKIYGTGQEAINALIQKYNGAAEKEQGLTKETKTLKHEFEDFEKMIGATVIPTLTSLASKLNDILDPSRKKGKSIFKELTEEIKTASNDAEKYMGKLDINKVIADNKKMIDGLNDAVKKHGAGGKKGILPSILAVDEFEVALRRAEEEFNRVHDAMVRKKIATTAILKKHTQEWIDAEVQSLTFLEETGKRVGTQFVASFSDAFAKTLIEGNNFGDQFENIMKNVEEAIISAITQMIIFRSLATAMGGPVGGFGPWAWGAGGSPSSPKTPNGRTSSPFTQNPSTMRTTAAALRNIQLYNGKPYGY